MVLTSRSTHGAVLAGILVGCCWLLLAGVGHAAKPPQPNLNELWEEYPLEPPGTSPDARPAPVPKPAETQVPPPPTSEAGTNWTPLALGAAGGGLLVLVLIATGVVLRARRRPSPPPLQWNTPAELIEVADALAKEAAECDMFLEGQRDEGIRGMSETADRDLSSAPATQSERDPSHYADIGERVASVLSAAETAANQIREDARLSAEEVLSVARQEADEVRRKAASYDADTRAAVDSFASERRREAEQEIQKQLAESEAQARATRQAAEAMARQIEEDGRRRGQALREESKAVEERLTKALVGLRRMTVEIEQLLGPSSGEGETLADALKPYGKGSGDEKAPPLVAVPNDQS